MRHLADFLLALLAVALADAVLFHFGAYFPRLQPESFSGHVERQTRRLESLLEAAPDARHVVVMGNSMTEAAVQESQLEAELAGDGRRFQVINYAIGGSSPRGWYVLLKNSLIDRGNTEIVVLGLHNNLLRIVRRAQDQDVEIAKTRMKVADGLAMAGAYQSRERRLEVLAGAVFRTLLFRGDLRQYLEDPKTRHRQLTRHRKRLERQGRRGARLENRATQDLLSARLGPDHRIVVDELDGFLKTDVALRRRIERVLRWRRRTRLAMAIGQQTEATIRLDPGKAELLAALVDDLNRKGVKVVFSVLPGGPYSLHRPPEVDHLGNLFRQLRRRGADVEMWHARAMIRRLEAPAYYKDELHLNAQGAEIYTRRLGRFLASRLDAEIKIGSR